MQQATSSARAILAVLVLALFGTACSSATASGPASAPQAASTTVEVRNNNWLDMVVYAVRSGMRVRLGMVNSMNATTFRVPSGMVTPGSSVQLEAHPIGSNQSFVAPPVQVGPGQRIDLTIQNHLSVSSIAVF